MERGEYEAKRTLAENGSETNRPRPPRRRKLWMQKTFVGRHRSKFLIGGGIVSGLLIILGIVSAVSYARHSCQLAERWNNSEIVRKNIFRERFREMLEEGFWKDKSEPSKEVQSFYGICMNEALIEERGLESLKGVIRRMGGWLLTDSECREGFYAESVHPYLRRYRFGKGAISLRVVPNYSTGQYSLKFTTDIVRRFASRCKDVFGVTSEKSFIGTTQDVWVTLGMSPHATELCFGHVLEFLNIVCQAVAEFSEEPYLSQSGTIGEIKGWEEFNPLKHFWWPYIGRGLPKDIPSQPGIVVQFEHSKALERILKDYYSTETIVNLAMWRFISSLRFYLPKQLREALTKMSPEPVEPVHRKSRWEGCLDEILTAYPLTSRWMYKQRYYNTDAWEEIGRIFRDVQTGFEGIFRKMNWMDTETRSRATEKLNGISLYIPDGFNRSERDFPRPLKINKTNPVTTFIDLMDLKLKRDYSFLDKNLTKEDVEFAAVKGSLSPRYMRGLNKLYIPVEYLHMYYERERPNHMNYLGLGFMIAREIAHGFFDGGFNMSKSQQQYSIRRNCFVQLYRNGSIHRGVNQTNETEAVNKILADYLGLRVAYSAYELSVKRGAINKTDIFWSSAGKWFRSNDTVGSELLLHLQDFHLDFGCPIDPNLNNTCSLREFTCAPALCGEI